MSMKPALSKTLAAALVAAASLSCGGRTETPPHADAGHADGATEGTGEAHHDEALPETVRLSAAAVAEAGIGTWTVKPLNLEHLLVLNGQVGHDENRLLQVSASVRGRVVSIPVDLGTRVREGDVLATIESVELGRAREELVRETSALRVAGRAWERAKALVAAKAISAGEFQSREGEYLTRQAAAGAAERSLHLLGEPQAAIDRLRAAAEAGAPSAGNGATLALRAPFAGRVIDRKVTPGAFFDALQPLLTLADIRTVWVFARVYERDLALVREGVAVTLRAEAYPQEAFRGRVDFVDSVVDPDTRTVRVRATVRNPEEKLRPGMFVKAQVDVPQSYEGRTVLAVPQSALQTLEGRTTLFVQQGEGVFGRRVVETGHTFEGFTEVYKGIAAGDVVVTEGSFVLKSEFAGATLADEH
jgi:cobalt-zinc-cadmium efflux system membrane fusion protein